MADNAIALISAIAGLWKLAAAIAVPLSLYFLRKPLAELVPKLKRLKTGDTEIELHDKAEVPPEPAKPAIQPTPPEKAAIIPELKPSDQPPFTRIFEALVQRDSDQAEKLFQELVQKEPGKKREHELFYLTLRCDLNKDAHAAARLEEFKSDGRYEDSLDGILHTLGAYYQVTDQYAKALEQFREAERTARKPSDKAFAIAAQARLLATLGDGGQALSLLTRSARQFAEPEALATVYRALADTHDKLGNQLENAVALEKAAEFRATDNHTLFVAAYAQSMSNLPYLSLHNYLRELTLDPTQGGARNNYAVQLAELGLLIHSVEQYRRAQKGGETLAMSNLAYLYIEKGFADDAERLLHEAQNIKDYHGNVDRALVKLRTDRDQEDEKLKAIEKWGRLYQTFVRSFAEALLLPLDKGISFAGEWKCSDGMDISISQAGEQLSTEWGRHPSRRKLTARLSNRAARGQFFTEQLTLFSPPVSPSYSDPKDVLLFLSEDGNTISMLSLGKEEPVHLTFAKKAQIHAEQ